MRHTKLLIISGVTTTALGIAGMVGNRLLQRVMATHYPVPVMRLLEEERIRHYPILLLFVGISLLLFGLVEVGKLRIPLFNLPRKTILTVLIAGGILISLRDWRYYGSPVWDGFGDFSRYFYHLIFQPGRDSLASFNTFIHQYAHSGSPLGPFLIGLLNGVIRDITLSYMILMGLATIGTALILKRIISRFYRLPDGYSRDYLILFFSHCLVMRSLFFPQMDALVMFWSNLYIYLAYLYLLQGKGIYLYLASAVITAAILTKVNGFFLIPLLPAAYILIGWREKKFRGGELVKSLFYTAIIPLGLFLFYLWRLQLLENVIHELSLRGMVDGSGIRFDHNPKLFLIACLIAFQIYPYLIWTKENYKNKAATLPALFVFITLACLIFSSAPFFLRFFLPIIPSILLLSIPKLESIRRTRPRLVNLVILWMIVFNYLILFLHLYY